MHKRFFYAPVEKVHSFPQFPQGFPQEMLEKQGFLPTYPHFCALQRCGLVILSTDRCRISFQKPCIGVVFVTYRRFGPSHLCQYRQNPRAHAKSVVILRPFAVTIPLQILRISYKTRFGLFTLMPFSTGISTGGCGFPMHKTWILWSFVEKVTGLSRGKMCFLMTTFRWQKTHPDAGFIGRRMRFFCRNRVMRRGIRGLRESGSKGASLFQKIISMIF